MRLLSNLTPTVCSIPAKGTLFGVIAETSSDPRSAGPIGHEPPRFDWVGRPEQTNMRLNNNGLEGTDDLRDLWNQQTPFALAEEVQPLFRKRLVESLTNWDMRDGKADWSPDALDAAANVYLDDFMLFDVSKPTSDTSYLGDREKHAPWTALSDRRRPHRQRQCHRHHDHLDGE